MVDPAQAVHLEQAIRAVDNNDRAAAIGALVNVEIATLDHLQKLITHSLWDTPDGRHPLALLHLTPEPLRHEPQK